MEPAKSQIYRFYRALTAKEYAKYGIFGYVPPNKSWAVYPPEKPTIREAFGSRIFNRVKNWVQSGESPYGKKEVLVYVNGTLDEFFPDLMETEVFKNAKLISLDRLIIELDKRKNWGF